MLTEGGHGYNKMSSAEPEMNKTTPPSAEPSAEPNTVDPNPEPLPDWDTALMAWKSLWEIHFIGFGLLFLGIALFSCICVVKIKHRVKGMTLGNYFLAVCSMLMVFSFSRTLFLILDPYESHTVLNLPVLLIRILFAIGYPCLTSALSLIHFAFLEVNKLRLVSRRLQSIKFLVSVIATHFVVVLVVYILITLAPKFARLLILCQTILIFWWLVLALCFLYSGWKVKWQSQLTAKFFKATTMKERAASTLSTSSLDSRATAEHKTHFHADQSEPPKGAQKIARISGLVSFLALLYVAAELYSLFSLYNLYDLGDENSVDHWSWWGYQTCNRMLDFLLCLVITYVIFPSTQIEKKHKSSGDSYSVRMNKNVMIRSFDKLDVV